MTTTTVRRESTSDVTMAVLAGTARTTGQTDRLGSEGPSRRLRCTGRLGS